MRAVGFKPCLPIMPYYGVPMNATYNGVRYEQIGMAFSTQIVTDLLRDQLGFGGYVNSDTGSRPALLRFDALWQQAESDPPTSSV